MKIIAVIIGIVIMTLAIVSGIFISFMQEKHVELVDCVDGNNNVFVDLPDTIKCQHTTYILFGSEMLSSYVGTLLFFIFICGIVVFLGGLLI